jgi:hypothetical protein
MPRRSSSKDPSRPPFSIVRQTADGTRPPFSEVSSALDNEALRKKLLQEIRRRAGPKGARPRAKKGTAAREASARLKSRPR